MRNKITLLAGAAVAILSLQHASAAGVSPAVTRVVRRIAEKRDWLAVTRLCSIDVMPGRASIVKAGNDHCKAPYDTCLSKCESGDGASCYWLAYQLQQNGAPSETYDALFQRSCKLGVVSGCTNHAAGLLSVNGDDVPTQKCAARTFEKGCDYDDPWACTMYAFHLSRGLGVAQDEALALKIVEKSCKYGDSDPACGYAKGLRQDILNRRSKKVTPKTPKH
jgi:hypothetical protein